MHKGIRIVVIESPSLQKAKGRYHFEEYLRVKLLGKGAATGLLIAVDVCAFSP